MSTTASPEDFELDPGHQPLADKTLEAVVSEGETELEKDQALIRITLNSAPQWLIGVLIALRHKHMILSSTAAVERLVNKLGIAVIRKEQGDAIETVRALRHDILDLGNHVALFRLYQGQFRLKETVGTTYRQCSCREWVAGAISDGLAEPIGLSISAATLLTLMAGVSRSEEWVPRAWVKVAAREMDHFAVYLSDEVRRLQEVLKTVQ